MQKLIIAMVAIVPKQVLYMRNVIDMKFCVFNLYANSCKVQSCKIFLEATFGENRDTYAEL